MAIKKIKFNLLSLFCLAVLASCGGLEANQQHPDSFFRDGRGISSFDNLNAFVNNQGSNPVYRKAKVTTKSGPLRLKVRADSSAPSPRDGPKNINKGEEILVYWPRNVVNNHINIFHNDQSLWVTYKSTGGELYVTLLEQEALPTLISPGARVVDLDQGNVRGGDLNLSPNLAFDIKPISLSPAVLDEAFLAIEKMQLEAAELPGCDFDPLVGNGAQKQNCYRKIVISDDFRNFIARHGYQCAQDAARETFGKNAQEILFHSSGAGQVSRNRKVGGKKNANNPNAKYSVHATGQALDLVAISVNYTGQSPRRIPLHRDHTDGSSSTERENYKFYWSYVNCWRKSVKTHSPCSCDSTLSGAITYRDDDKVHFNHLHMSVPFCRRGEFNVSCV